MQHLHTYTRIMLTLVQDDASKLNRPWSGNVTLYSSKIDETGWRIECKDDIHARTFIKEVSNAFLQDADYGIKFLTKTGRVVLRVSLTGTI